MVFFFFCETITNYDLPLLSGKSARVTRSVETTSDYLAKRSDGRPKNLVETVRDITQGNGLGRSGRVSRRERTEAVRLADNVFSEGKKGRGRPRDERFEITIRTVEACEENAEDRYKRKPRTRVAEFGQEALEMYESN